MSEFGYKLDPSRKLRKQKGIKGTRRNIVNTYNPSTIDQGGILPVRFPDLGRDDVIVPGTAKLSFDFTIDGKTDNNATIVNNLGRAIVSKLEVKLEGAAVYTLTDSDIFH
jgi:hypothetical protein